MDTSHRDNYLCGKKLLRNVVLGLIRRYIEITVTMVGECVRFLFMICEKSLDE